LPRGGARPVATVPALCRLFHLHRAGRGAVLHALAVAAARRRRCRRFDRRRARAAASGQLEAAAFSNVAVWPRIGTDFNDTDFRRDFFDSLYYCAAVVGINTSALLEAGIVGRPVFTVTVPEFAHSQDGTLHFQHLVHGDSGLVRAAASLDEHVAQLSAALAGEGGVAERDRAFVGSFIRPLGLDRPAAPVFARTVETLASLPRPDAAPEAWTVRAARTALRPLASLARTLAEDRPLWVYAARPLLNGAVRLWAAAASARDALRGS